PDDVARAAEAADPPRPADDAAAHCGPAAGTFCYGRPPLGRSNHPGIAHPAGRSRSHRPYPGAVDLSARLQPTLDGTCASDPGDAAALTASSGGGDDGPGGAWQSPSLGSGGANRG